MNNKFFCISLMLGLMVCANAQNVITVDASGNELYSRQFDVPMQQNNITWLSGAFFNGSGSSSTTISGVTVNTDWAGETHLTF